MAHIRLWGWAKKRATFPGSAWLLKLILHLEKILPLNAYSLWAETDVNPAYRQIPGPGCLLRSAQLLTGKLPSSHVGVWWLLRNGAANISGQALYFGGTQNGTLVCICCYT